MHLLYTVIISPIEAIVELVFSFALQKFSRFGVGGAIVAVSLAINFLALPLYNIADELQLRERRIQNKMADRVKRIKAAFTGDERFMMLQAYYRINGYHPMYALRSSLSILIEIPFFIAAYHFLSNCSALNNQSILFLKDLSSPDRLISFSLFGYAIYINILPVLMTLINGVSSFVYTKDAPFREKIQVYALALLFLAILYNSPSGLVFYWILNNTFSLLKNIVQKMKHPGAILYGCLSLLFVFASAYVAFFMGGTSIKKKMVVYVFTVCFIAAPYIIRLCKNTSIAGKVTEASWKSNQLVFLFSCLSLWILSGIILPSNVIASSPVEFSFIGEIDSPIFYIKSSAFFFFGLFVFWPFCIYKLFSENVKKCMDILLFTLAVCAILNAFVFKYEYGTLDILFVLTKSDVLKVYSLFYVLLPLVVCVLCFLLYGVSFKYHKVQWLSTFLAAVCIGELVISGINLSKIQSGYSSYKELLAKQDNTFHKKTAFNLSKTEKNIIVLFYDRALPNMFKYIMDDYPEIKEELSGFTFYPNCVSFSTSTILSVPSMVGGYEYTPEALNEREGEKLIDKHNEAFNVIPELLAPLGFDVVLSNPPFINYEWGFDDDGFTSRENVEMIDLRTEVINQQYKIAHQEDFENVKRTELYTEQLIRSFSVMQILYPPLRQIYYNDGVYYKIDSMEQSLEESLENYATLYYLPELTSVDNDHPSYMFFDCETTHEATLMLADDYRPGVPSERNRIAGTGSYPAIYSAETKGVTDFISYHVNAAAWIQTAKFLRYLKENEVWDNSRIIILSDHGLGVEMVRHPDFHTENLGHTPLLLMKDFGEQGELKEDYSFTSIAELVNLVIKDLPVEKINPMTGNPLKTVSDFEELHVYGCYGDEYNAHNMKNRTQFTLVPELGFSIHDDVSNPDNWVRLDTLDGGSK